MLAVPHFASNAVNQLTVSCAWAPVTDSLSSPPAAAQKPSSVVISRSGLDRKGECPASSEAVAANVTPVVIFCWNGYEIA